MDNNIHCIYNDIEGMIDNNNLLDKIYNYIIDFQVNDKITYNISYEDICNENLNYY